jgi:hypothetical protein
MSKDNKTLLKASAIALVLAALVVYASNNVEAIEDLIG